MFEGVFVYLIIFIEYLFVGDVVCVNGVVVEYNGIIEIVLSVNVEMLGVGVDILMISIEMLFDESVNLELFEGM